MPEPFKNWINQKLIQDMAFHFKRHWQAFDEKAFTNTACDGLETLELKERTQRITESMKQYLPADFEQAAEIILKSLGTPLNPDLSGGGITDEGIAGWGIMAMVDYVGLYGTEHFDTSMNLFKELTKRSSSEFGIRYFLLAFPEKTLAEMKKWAMDESLHVRRLASEGSRPRLPWGMRLPLYIEDPRPVIELLEILKDDETEYVRRSVANNLNDIAKDHPDLVADIAEKWLKKPDKNRKRMVKHACRTLIKNGHEKTLQVLGYGKAHIEEAGIAISNKDVLFGTALEFQLSLSSKVSHDQDLMIDYAIHHQKANGSTTPKVFKWKITSLKSGKTLKLSKKHAFKPITTRVYYPGLHKLEVLVNGASVGIVDFELRMEAD